MGNPANVDFVGGSQQQKVLFIQAHQMAVHMVQQAQQAARRAGATFTTWFGSSSTETVSRQFGEILDFLSRSKFIYDLNPDHIPSYLAQK